MLASNCVRGLSWIECSRYKVRCGDAGYSVNSVQLRHYNRWRRANEQTKEKMRKVQILLYGTEHWYHSFWRIYIYRARLRDSHTDACKKFRIGRDCFCHNIYVVPGALRSIWFVWRRIHMCSRSDTRFLFRPWMFVDVINFYCDFFSVPRCLPFAYVSQSCRAMLQWGCMSRTKPWTNFHQLTGMTLYSAFSLRLQTVQRMDSIDVMAPVVQFLRPSIQTKLTRLKFNQSQHALHLM